MRHAATALLPFALACAAGRPDASRLPRSPEQGSLLRPAELARVRCLLVAPFENGSDAPLAAEAATTAVLSAIDPAHTRVLPVAELRGLFADTPLELPQGIPPSLALELAELVGADAALWGTVEGRSLEGAPELLVTLRLALAGDRRLLFAETGLVRLSPGERPEVAVRDAAVELARPMLTRLGEPGKKRCFELERSRTLRAIALEREGPPRQAATPRQAEWARRLSQGERLLVEDVSFEGRSAALQRESGLADLAAALLARPGLRVRVEGFVDATSDRSGDQRLSAAMAHAAGMRLLELGVPRKQLTWAGRGGESPVLPSFTARGRAANRRVEAVAAP